MLQTTGEPGATDDEGHVTLHAPPTALMVTEKFPAAGAVTVTVPKMVSDALTCTRPTFVLPGGRVAGTEGEGV